MSEWTVLLPGPSLAAVRREDFRPAGPVVAVNSAVLSPLRSDFWCMQDSVRVWEQTASKVAVARAGDLPVVWCQDQQREAWAILGFQTAAHPDTEEAFRTAFVRAPAGVRYTALTMLVALARVVFAGASRVIVYGCDLEGVGYAHGTDLRNRHPMIWQERWKSEKGLLPAALAQWTKVHGTRFEFRGRANPIAAPS
jgi:hypothetical protein